MAKVTKKWHGDRAKATIAGGRSKGLRLGAEHLLGASRAVVPIDEATLERSGTATVDEAQGKAAVSYDTVYAVKQHEELDWQHDAGRTAKYLERPMHEEAEAIRGIIAAEARKALGR